MRSSAFAVIFHAAALSAIHCTAFLSNAPPLTSPPTITRTCIRCRQRLRGPSSDTGGSTTSIADCDQYVLSCQIHRTWRMLRRRRLALWLVLLSVALPVAAPAAAVKVVALSATPLLWGVRHCCCSRRVQCLELPLGRPHGPAASRPARLFRSIRMLARAAGAIATTPPCG